VLRNESDNQYRILTHYRVAKDIGVPAMRIHQIVKHERAK